MVRLAKYEKDKKAEDICNSDGTNELEELKTDLMSDSNDTRSDAKSIFETCTFKRNLHVFANKLYRLLSSSLDLNSCTIYAILLRKTLINKFDTPFLRFPDGTQSALKAGLLELVNTSVDTPTRPINKELCHTVSALAVSLLPTKKCPEFKWPEFLSSLSKLVTSDKKREWLIAAHLAQYLGKRLKELYSVKLYEELHSVKLYEELHSVLLQCLTEGEGEDVRIAVWGAAINFILCLEQKDLVNFQDLLAAMMSTLKCGGNETMADAVNTLKLLISLAGMKPMFLRKQIVEMVKTILLMADDHSLEKETRCLAIEFVLTSVQFVLTLAEVEKTNPELLKLETEFEINMKEMWDDNEETDNYGCWQGCVERLSYRNGILTVALEVFPAYLTAPKGQKGHAELIALSKSIIKWNCRECLEKEGEWDVRVAALGAAINFFPCPDLLTSMLSMLEKVLEDGDKAMAGEVFELLTKLVEPTCLVGQIEEWVNRMWKIANNDGLNVEMRRWAIVLLSKLAQVKEIAPWLQRNVRELFEILMNMLDHIDDDDPYADYVYAWEGRNHWNWRRKTCLDMLFIAVSRNGIFSVALEVLGEYLNVPEWQKKYSAFIVIAQSIKSCHEVTIENLEKVVQMVLSPFPNAHRYVRCAAIEAIQQLLTHLLRSRLHEEVMRINFELMMSKLLSSFQDDDPVVQKASIDVIEKLARYFGERSQVGCHLVLLALAEVMNDSPNQDKRASAASAILVLSEYCTRDNLREHFDSIVSRCLIVLQEVKKFAMRNRSIEWEMILWHDVRWQHGMRWHDLRSWQEMLSEAWVEIWRNEDRDFSPYVDSLMSPVFHAAQLDPDNPRYDRFEIIEEKAMACHVLCFCVDELTEWLVPLIGQVVYTLILFLKWYHDAPVADARYCAKAIRIAVASVVPKILNSVRSIVESSDPEDYDHTMQYVEELSDMVIAVLNEASDVEPDAQVRYDILYALRDCQQ